MSLAPFNPGLSTKVSSTASPPTSTNTSYRPLRPRRSASSLRSIPEHRSKEVDQPPLPIPATPWIEQTSPGLLNTLVQPRSCSSSPSSNEPPSLAPLPYLSSSVDPAHLQAQQPSSPYQTRPDEQFAVGPHTVPGPRDQRSLSRYRLGSQPLSSRHSEGSQYASSSNWTPSSTTGSRTGSDLIANGMRSSIASRDSRFTAETDYDDYVHPKPILLQQSHQNAAGPHSHPLNLSVSASWHSGDQPNHKFPSTGPTPQTKSPQRQAAPTLLSLINLDQSSRNPHDMVGLGITSDQTISLTRGSRSPSLTGANDSPRAVLTHPVLPKTSRMARSASSSVSNGTSLNPSPFNHIYSQHQNPLTLNSRPSRTPTPLADRSTPSKTLNFDPGDSPNTCPGNLYIPPNSIGQAGFAYDSGNPSNPTSGHNTPSKGRASSAGGSTRKPLTSNTPESPIEHREHFTPKGHFAEGSTESKHRFYQHQSHWDDFDDQSPVLHSSTQIPSQAVALVEDGLGCIVDVSNSKLPLEKLAVPEDTTHLLLAKTFAPFLVGALLASKLPTIAATLVVLDISDAGLTSLPSAISYCEVLEELNVSGNVMANGELPIFLSNLTALKVLAADRCGLYQIAYPYDGLTHLRDLSVRYNHLRSLPSWLCLLPRLEILLVDGNEFEPPWQELVEPLLFSNFCGGAEAQLPSLVSSDSTELRHITSSHASPVASSLGSTLRSLPESSHNALTPPDDHRRNASAERPKRGRRHLAGLESTWVTSASSLLSDHMVENEERPHSAYSVEDSNHLTSPRSNYLRRLRSTNDMAVASTSRSLSTHENPPHSIASLMDPNMPNIPHNDSHADGFRPPHSLTSLPRRPSSSAVAQQGTSVSPQEYTDGSTYLAPSRNDSKALLTSETSQLALNNAAQKKSFGFLKKMSLGKLRREPGRSRTASTASNSLYNMKSSGNPASEAHSLDPSKLMSPDDVTLQESDEYRQTDRSSKSSADEPQGSKYIDSRHTHSSAKKKMNNRRSFLRLEDHFAPQKSPTKHPGTTAEQASSPRVEALNTSSLTKSGEQVETPNDSNSASFPSLPSPNTRWTSLRSIMMYLRDVHDLSGDFARAPGNVVSGGVRPVLSTNISRAASTKHSQPPSSLLSDGKSSAPSAPYQISATDFDPEGSDNNPCNGNLAGASNIPPTCEPPKVTENALRRYKVMEEIVATEKSYIKGLKELYDIYITSASLMVSSSIGKEKEPMVPPAERKVVFNNVEAIIGFHVDVLLPDFQEVMDRLRQKQSGIATADMDESASTGEDLLRRRQEVDSQLTNFAAEELARVFIRHAAFLKLYSTYITQFDTALERLREWSVTAPAASTNAPAWAPSGSASTTPAANHHSTLSGGQKKRLKTYMKRCRAHSSHTQMNLESYLLMPVQRLPRYKLLLENLVSCTPDLNCMSACESDSRSKTGKASDRPLPLTPNKVAVEALNIVSAVTAEMNERKRDSEGRQRLLYWQQRFGNKFRSPLVQPHRTLIKEGTMSLTRTVKLTTKDAATGGSGPAHPAARIRVPVLNTDSQPVAMIVLLCTDLLVLVKDPGDGGTASNQSPASLFQALRLAQHSRPYMSLPATIFGADKTMIRFVDNRAIFYFQCDCQRSAAAWMVAINQQVPLL